MPETLEWGEFARRYCERMVSTPEELHATMAWHKTLHAPDGWLLLECQDLCSSRLGEYVIVTYGPNNTLKAVPDHPVSPRGLASDMSVAVAILPADKLPESL